MNPKQYKQRLLDLEKTVSARAGAAAAEGRRQFLDTAHDLGDASVADEVATEKFAEAGSDADVLNQVRDALARIADGTFGKCIVDGEPIETKRLDAVPWTPYCLKHEQQFEGPPSKASTL
jgi:DnaK suppressor protein